VIVLDPYKVQKFWEDISRSFQRTPLELLLEIILIVVLAVALITILVAVLRRERKRRIEKARSAFERGLDRRRLSAADEDLLWEMASLLPKGRESALASLLTDLSVFNAAARRLLQRGTASETQIARLRIRLGLVRPGSAGVLHYTQELEAGTPVMVRPASGASSTDVPGVVEEVGARSFTVRLELVGGWAAAPGGGARAAHPAGPPPGGAQASSRIASPFRRGREVELRVFRPAGLYAITARVLKAGGGAGGAEAARPATATNLELEHSVRIERVQKRRYFRKLVKLPLYVKPLQPEGEAVKTRLRDLGGGGARFENSPGLRLWKGQSVLLVFQPEKTNRIVAKGRVVRASKTDGTTSVAFEAIRETTRDRIMRLVLR